MVIYSEVPYDYAPDVRSIGGRVVFSASRRGEPCTFYVSADPLTEPFQPLTIPFDFWDPDMFEDDDGRVYFYWGCTNKEPIWGIEIDPKTMLPIGERQAMFGEDEAQSRLGTERREQQALRAGHRDGPAYQAICRNKTLYRRRVYDPFVLPEGIRTDMDAAAPKLHLLSCRCKAKASSAQEGFGPELGTDENIRTWWAAKDEDTAPWYQVDLGAVRQVAAVQINLADHNMPAQDVPAEQMVLPLLADNGEAKLAFDLLLQKECPGWMYQVKRGATTVWERWDALRPDGTVNESKMSNDNMVSFNHYAFGSVGEFYYRYILGIQPLEPGFAKVRIRPFMDARLGNVKGSYRSRAGEIAVSWQMQDGTALLEVVTPMHAEILLPDGEVKQVPAGTYQYQQAL